MTCYRAHHARFHSLIKEEVLDKERTNDDLGELQISLYTTLHDRTSKTSLQMLKPSNAPDSQALITTTRYLKSLEQASQEALST